MKLLELLGFSKVKPERPIPTKHILVRGRQYKVKDYGNPKYADLIVTFSHIAKENIAIVEPIPGQTVDHCFGVPAGEIMPWTEGSF